MELWVELWGRTLKFLYNKFKGFLPLDLCISPIHVYRINHILKQFLELWKSIDKFDGRKGNLKNYIISIARHVGINVYNRKIIKHELIPLEEDDLEFELDLTNEVSKTINKNIIKETLESLPQPDRDIFIRRYYLFESVKEIAASLELPPKTVENKLYRGKDNIRTALINKGIIL